MEYGLKFIFWEGTDSFVDLECLMKIFEGSVWVYKIPSTFMCLDFGIEISVSLDIQSHCQNGMVTFLF